jgi:hypothetical protein
MAKKRTVIGSIIKGRDGKPDYIKINNDVVLTVLGASNTSGLTQRVAAAVLLQGEAIIDA